MPKRTTLDDVPACLDGQICLEDLLAEEEDAGDLVLMPDLLDRIRREHGAS